MVSDLDRHYRRLLRTVVLGKGGCSNCVLIIVELTVHIKNSQVSTSNDKLYYSFVNHFKQRASEFGTFHIHQSTEI